MVLRRFYRREADVVDLEHDGATRDAPGRLGRVGIRGFFGSHRGDLLWFVDVLQEFDFVVAGVEVFSAPLG